MTSGLAESEGTPSALSESEKTPPVFVDEDGDGATACLVGAGLRIRWLGAVTYDDAWALQKALFASRRSNHLLLLEHPPVFTIGVRGDESNILVDPSSVGATVRHVDRGGDVTWHGPGQLVGYPILTIPGKRGGGMADTADYVHSVEQLLIDTLGEFGLANAGRLREYPGVWIDPESDNPRKIAAIGVRLSRARTMHGFALNVDPDPVWFERLIPCGITDKAVTTMAAEGVAVTMRDVVDAVSALATQRWGRGAGNGADSSGANGAACTGAGGGATGVDRSDVAWKHGARDLSAFSRGLGPGTPTAHGNGREATAHGNGREEPVRLLGRLAEVGVTDGLAITERKPPWMRVKANMGPEYRKLKSVMRDLDLVTVCEEAGCPNIFECWNDGTATFMINGERCTRACGFCLVDTRKPEPLDPQEPARVAEAIAKMGLRYAVVTTVARDDLDDGGAGAFAATIAAIRARVPECKVEVLISDCKGEPRDLDVIFAAKPDVLNHNIETVPRLQRAVRPSASYARSLAVLSRAKATGLVTKSSIIVGMGEENHEVVSTLADLAAIETDIVTIGQYLRPTSNHLPIARWWTPEEFDEMKRVGETLGIVHVEAGPLTRSSYHARGAEQASAEQAARRDVDGNDRGADPKS